MTPRERLTPSQRNLLIALTLAVAVTRLVALSHSIWDWDEGLFCMALHDYDVVHHHPHPPGFPTFILLAKIARLFVTKDFHALRAVSTLAAMTLFPLLFALARELRYPFRTSLLAALIFTFLPNVWFYGGTAFTDIAALASLLAAVTATLRGRDDRRWYFLGSLLIGLSVTFRPQNALMALYPWLLASWPRFRARRFDPLIAAGLALLVAAIGYGGAAAATGSWHDYKRAVDEHGHYVMAVDGWRNPGRPPVAKLLPTFAIDPYRAHAISEALFAMAVIGLLAAAIRRDRRAFEVLAIFGPFFVLALFMLSPTDVGRLSIGYLPMHALLAADGMAVVAAILSMRRERIAAALHVALALAAVGCAIGWVAPALREVRRHDSPPVEAMRWLTRNVPKGDMIYVQGGLVPFADYALPGWNYELVGDQPPDSLDPRRGHAWYVVDARSNEETAVNFLRRRQRLWSLFCERYFEVSVRRVTGGATFSGWHAEESSDDATWRWMPETARMSLTPMGGPGELHLALYAPLDSEPPPLVTIAIDGKVVDSFRPATSELDKTYAVDSPAGRRVEVVFTVDHVIQPPHDGRRLGLRLNRFSWKPATH